MKVRTAVLAALAAEGAAAHAIFQQLWVNDVDYDKQCVRMPPSNSPVTNVQSTDMRCNSGGSRGVAAKCPVKAGDTVTVEMHQQPGDRSCTSEAIGGQHYGPVMIYLSKVADSSTADGSSGWYKIFQDGWNKNASGKSGDDDYWGVKDLNTCCGKMTAKIPADTPPGDYLLRAEVVALHVASALNGAQLYMSCYQITVTNSGAGTAVTDTVKFPGAYSATDPGIHFDIHSPSTTYVVPGPAVISSGSTKKAGAGCTAGTCEATCKVGSGPKGTASAVPKPTGGSSAPDQNCQTGQFQQCGGQGYTGCTLCPSGQTCKQVSGIYYSQCS